MTTVASRDEAGRDTTAGDGGGPSLGATAGDGGGPSLGATDFSPADLTLGVGDLDSTRGSGVSFHISGVCV